MTFELADNLNVSTIKAGDTVTGNYSELGQTGLTINQGNAPVITIADGNVNFGGNTLAGVSEGLIGAGSTEAVNGSQLYAVGNSTANALGGNSSFDSSTGTVTANLDVSGNSYNTVQDALDAVNTTASRGWDVSTEGGTTTNVAPGATVDFSNTDGNIEIANSGTSLTFELADNISVNSMTAGDTAAGNYSVIGSGGTTVTDALGNQTTYGANGISIGDTAGSTFITINNGDVNFGDNTLTGVADGVTAGDAVNKGQLDDAGKSLTSAGLNFAGNAGSTVHKDLGQTMSIVGALTPAAGIAVDNAAAVAGTYSSRNVQTATDALGNLQIQIAENPFFNSVTAGDTAAGNFSVLGSGGTTVTDAAGNQTTYGANGISIGDTAGSTFITINNGNVNFGGNVIHGVGDGVTAGDAVNKGQLDDAGKSLTSAGLNFAGNAGSTVHKDLGQTMSIVGALTPAAGIAVDNAAAVAGTYSSRNVQTATDALGNLQINLVENPFFDAVTANTVAGNFSVLGSGGTTVTDAAGNQTTYGANGISIGDTAGSTFITINNGNVNFGGNVIHGVGDGVTAGDAVNKGQLDDAGKSLTSAGLNFAGNAGSTVHKDLGQTMSIVGALTPAAGIAVDNAAAVAGTYSSRNVQTATDALGNLQIQIAENPFFNSVTAGDTASGNFSVLGSGGTTVTDAAGNKAVYGANTATLTDTAGNTNTTTAAGNTLVDAAGNTYNTTAAGSVLTDAAGNTTSLTAAGTHVEDALGNNATYGANAISLTDAAGNVYDTTAVGSILTNSNGDITNLSAAGTTVTDALGNQTTYGANGISIGDTAGSTFITINNGNVNFGGNVINGVGDGVTAGDAVNKGQLDGLGKAGLNFAGNAGNTVHKDLGATMSIVGKATANGAYDGQNVKTVTDAAGNLQIQIAENPFFNSVLAGETGTQNLSIMGSGGTTVTDAAGNKAVYGANAATLTDTAGNTNTTTAAGNTLVDAAGNTYNTTAAGSVLTDAAGNTTSLTAAGTHVEDALGNNATYGANAISLTDAAGNTYNTTAGGSTITNNNGDVTEVTAAGTQVTNKAGDSATYGAEGITIVNKGGNTIVINDGNVNFGGNTLSGVNAGTTGGDAVNLDQVTNMVNNAGNSATLAGLNFAGNAGSTVHKDLGQTLSIVGDATTAGTYSGQNVKTITDAAGNLKIQIAERPVFDTVTANAVSVGNTSSGNLISISDKGISIANNGGDTITISNTGGNVLDFGGVTLSGVNAGSISATSTDAVNGSQLFGMGNSVANSLGGSSYYDAGSNKVVTGLNVGGNTYTNVQSALDAVNQTASSGWNVSANGGSASNVAPGATVDFGNTDGNVQISNKGGNITVDLADNLKVDSIEVGGNKLDKNGLTVGDTTISSDGMVIAGGPSVTKDGIDAGGKVITNVADGVADSDAVNVGQLNKAINDSTTVINKNINDIKDDIGNMDDLFDTFDVSGQTTTDRKNLVDTINAINTTGVKYAHTNDGGDPTKIGTTNDSSAGGKNSSAFGVGAIVEAGADSSVAMGHNTFVSSKATNAVAIGSGSQALGESAIAMGHGSVASGKQSISIGTGNKVSGNSSGALGDPNTVSGNGSYAIGNNNTITQDNSFVLGNEVTIDSSASDMSKSNGATFMGSVALGNGSTVSKPVGTASTTIQGTEYKFAGSKPVGTVSVGSAGEERTVTNVAAGQISADSTDAINGSQLYATNKAIENIKTGGAGVVQYSDADSPTKSNGGKVTNNATLVGADVNAPVTLSNVADGKAPTDAVNVRQLQQMGASINNRIDSVEDNADAGTATAMAVAGLPQAYLPGKSMVSMSGGVYRGQTGYAVGYSTISEGGNWVIKAAASGNAQGYFGGTAGVGYQW
ncbi:YadA-like family protein [Vitreoscilla massiliensis]|uniref:YadA-like family protein n=1 Tax=Vitreoscilla massiliensis TaxID=1689272 RepID=UPI00071C5A7D|nr:YadA-like family protein [Vitreoscilla massiliensis]